MVTGRCITGTSGCTFNVLPIMDERCSGRRQCDVDIRDLLVAVPQSICDRNLRNYLQAAYTCVRGITRCLCCSFDVVSVVLLAVKVCQRYNSVSMLFFCCCLCYIIGGERVWSLLEILTYMVIECT